jgi:hypothetical protein
MQFSATFSIPPFAPLGSRRLTPYTQSIIRTTIISHTAPHEFMHRAHVRSEPLTPSSWPRHEARRPPGGPLFVPPPPLPSHPFPNSAARHERLCDSESGKGKLETRRAAAWPPARSTRRWWWRRRRRRRIPARRSSPRPQTGRRRFGFSTSPRSAPTYPDFHACFSARRSLRPGRRGATAASGPDLRVPGPICG